MIWKVRLEKKYIRIYERPQETESRSRSLAFNVCKEAQEVYERDRKEGRGEFVEESKRGHAQFHHEIVIHRVRLT